MSVDKETENAHQHQTPALTFDEFPPTDYGTWKEEAIKALKGTPFEKSMYTKTYEGIQLEPIYTAENVKSLSHPHTFPAAPDMLRGTSASGYISEPWKISQISDAALPEKANKELKNELAKGSTSINIRLDAPTLAGADASPANEAEIGGTGVSVSSLKDLETLLADVDFGKYEFHVDAGLSGTPMLAAVVMTASKTSVPLDGLKGCIGTDLFGVLMRNGRLPRGTDAVFDEIADTLIWADKNTPEMRTLLINGSTMHNAGANCVQEVAYAMAAAIELFRALQERKVDIGMFARHIRFEFSLGSNFFMEIAKLRAARAVWSQIVKAFGGNEDAEKINVYGRTSFFTKTEYDPYVNMLRNTTEALSGVVGGLDGMTVGCFDEAVRSGDDFSRRVARNLQIMMQTEFNLLQPLDPAGGSWYVESLTDELARKIWELMQKTESEGGFLKSLQSGSVQQSIGAVLQERFKKLGTRADRAVGTNMYANIQEQPLEKSCPCNDSSSSKLRISAVEECRQKRDSTACKAALDALQGRKSGSLFDLVSASIQAGATLGEISAALGKDGAENKEIQPLGQHRWTEQYEALRHRTENYKKNTGKNLKVFLANMGPLSQHKARADFITAFMEVGAFELLGNDGFASVDECASAAAKSEADVAVICSTDATYPELVPSLTRQIKTLKPGMKVFLAGAPAEEFKSAYLEAGIDDFISVRSNCLETLSELQKAKGMQ